MRILALTIFGSIFCVSLFAQEAEKGHWIFRAPVEATQGGLLDLRYLNEEYAGENGFIRLSGDGEYFVHGTGERIRFWAINGGDLANEHSDSALAAEARFLARRGVNLIRFHAGINPKGSDPNLFAVDTNEVKNIWRCVAAMKKEGIYTVISPFWPHNGHMGGVNREWGIDGYGEKDDLWGVLFFYDKLQRAYREWIKYLYTTPNEYTGNALKDEPAVAVIQIENEDAVFFWTMQGVKPPMKRMIAEQFASWLKKKYGSLALAATAWKNATLAGDDPAHGVVALYGMYEMTLPEKDSNSQRLADQVAFYAETQRNFYDGIVQYIKKDLHCRQLVNANNWRTASQSRLLDLERWTNAGADVMAVNKYFDPGHSGPNNGWRVDPGDFYTAPSALRDPQDLSTNIRHVAKHPMMVTEGGWNLPNRYQTEGPLLVAAYGALTGLDAFFWFHAGSIGYDADPYFNFVDIGGQHPLKRWTNATPGEIGMFPANALIARLGYVKESAPVLREYRSMHRLYHRDIPAVYEEQSFDPNRDFEFHPENGGRGGLSPLTFLVGKVAVSLNERRDSTVIAPSLERMIDPAKKVVRSITGEHRLDYGNGIFELNTPKAKAVSGFLKLKGKFDLGTVTIECSNRYATIEVVSMDEMDIANSKKILVQVGTVFRPTGWEEEAANFEHAGIRVNGFKITNTGRMPWQGADVLASLRIRNTHLRVARQLDAAGNWLRDIAITKSQDGISLELPNDAFYILLQ